MPRKTSDDDFTLSADCMAMSRSFWNRKIVLLFAQFVPGLCYMVPLSAAPAPIRHRPMAKATQVVPGQYVAGFFPSGRNVDGIDRERTGLDFGHGFLVHIGRR